MYELVSSLLLDIENNHKRISMDWDQTRLPFSGSVFQPVADNQTDFLTGGADFETRSFRSAPLVGLESVGVYPPSYQITLPKFSLNGDAYVPQKSIIVDGELSPIYLNVLEKSNSTINIFSNGELSDYAVIMKFHQIQTLLEQEAAITVTGFFFNVCGWYVRYRGESYSAEVAKKVYNECVSDVSFQHRARISLNLLDPDYINLLIYVAEVSEK